jgi:hypothetical protein
MEPEILNLLAARTRAARQSRMDRRLALMARARTRADACMCIWYRRANARRGTRARRIDWLVARQRAAWVSR